MTTNYKEKNMWKLIDKEEYRLKSSETVARKAYKGFIFTFINKGVKMKALAKDEITALRRVKRALTVTQMY
mgnify:FL=1